MPSPSDRRSEPRRPVSGDVHLRQLGTLAGSFSGQLIDIAATGFRARHNRLTLASGQMVEFEMKSSAGLARVVWTRIVDGEAEAGFRILPEESQ
jgi:hypothetical protein